MAAHGFSDAQMEYIGNTIELQTRALRQNIESITDNAQAAFTQAQTKIELLMAEAT